MISKLRFNELVKLSFKHSIQSYAIKQYLSSFFLYSQFHYFVSDFSKYEIFFNSDNIVYLEKLYFSTNFKVLNVEKFFAFLVYYQKLLNLLSPTPDFKPHYDISNYRYAYRDEELFFSNAEELVHIYFTEDSKDQDLLISSIYEYVNSFCFPMNNEFFHQFLYNRFYNWTEHGSLKYYIEDGYKGRFDTSCVYCLKLFEMNENFFNYYFNLNSNWINKIYLTMCFNDFEVIDPNINYFFISYLKFN